VPDAGAVQGVVERQDGAARQAEDDLYLLAAKAFEQDLGTREKLAHV
jgi:hypothetical protein